MREAERSLDEGDAGRAADEQMEALDELRDGARSADALNRENRMAREQREQGQQNAQNPGEGGDQAAGEGRSARQRSPLDPLGRSMGSLESATGLDVERFTPPRAREILRELRRRAGEMGRPPEELEYLERLLERFQ